MDLRLRLVGYLGALLLALLLAASLMILQGVREDAAAEVRASERLAQVMLAAGELGHGGNSEATAKQLAALLAEGPLRHLSIRLTSGEPTPPPLENPTARWFARLLNIEPPEKGSYRIQLQGRELVISPNPTSEIEEKLQDATRFCIALLFFSVATLLVAWTAAHRALAPVRDLERGLNRLAQGEFQTILPHFALREFQRIARAINQMAGALDSARQNQQRLARQLITVQEAERHQLAQELHDEMGQLLTGIGVTAAYVHRHAADAPVEKMAECGREIVEESRALSALLRTMLRRLRPHGLSGPGLPAALQEMVRSWQQREPAIRFDLEIPADFPALDEEIGLVLYRVLQEALTNVVKHSGARTCSAGLESVAGYVVLSIRDDGCGLVGDIGKQSGSGLLGMRERLAMVGGEVQLMNTAPSGLCLTARIPASGRDKEGTAA